MSDVGICFLLFYFTSVVAVSRVTTSFSGCILRLELTGVSEVLDMGFE